jgi:hypothetical protein
VVVTLAAGLTPIGTLGNLVSIGTLMAFVIVSTWPVREQELRSSGS